MQIPVLIEPVAGNGYRARGGKPLPLCAEGATRAEALAKLKEQLQARLSNGAELVAIEVPSQENPWLRMAGMYDPNDPDVQGWIEEMKRYREEVEQDPNYL
ncbi:MAG TPA: hypothetical protein VKI65_03475 [Gemmataceae bacterium]|nr:hypothetical protein [Gemmataceae bacterium]